MSVATALKKDKVAQFIVELQKKVEAKIVTQAEAERLAILALEEVMPGDNWAEAADEDMDDDMAADDSDEESAEDAPAGSAVDPKSELLAALTAYNGATGSAWKTFKQKVEAVVRGTSGNAVPIGKYTLGAGETNSTLDIQQKDQASLDLSFFFKQDWTVGGLVLPPPTMQQQQTEASVKDSACHLPLRKRLLALAETLSEASSAELTWRSAKLPIRELADMERIARQEKDLRVLSCVTAAPNSDKAKDWSSWSLKAQVYLLGGDYVKTEASVKFEDIA